MAVPETLAARARDPKVAAILHGQAELFAARKAALDGEVSLLGQRVQQLREQITGIEAQQTAKARQVRLIRGELKDLKALFTKGLVPRPRILSLEREAERLKGERGEHVAEIARARTSISETEIQILQLRKTFREQVVTELRELETEKFDLTERKVVARDELRRVDIRAPQSGRVVGLAVHTIGAVIGPGETLTDIVPDGDELVVEARVAPEEVDKVSHGLAAVVTLSAFERNTTPELAGEVVTISADRLVDQATNMPYYAVRIRIPVTEMAKLGDLKLRAGMPAECFIQTGARTALSYLMKPFNDAARRVLRDS
jgi:HlyD family type I secretion membrane fusion protein